MAKGRKDLNPGDVLISLGNRSISNYIKRFDGSGYSHASIFDGERVIEAVAEGVMRNTLEDFFDHRVFADVYRFKSDDDGFLPGTRTGRPSRY